MTPSAIRLRQVWSLAAVDARRLWRAKATLRFAVVSPVVIVVLLALFRDLEFAFAGQRIRVLDFAITGMVAFWGAHFGQDTMVAAASAYRSRGLLKRIAVTPISSATFVFADLGARALIGVGQTLFMLALAMLVGARIEPSPNLLWLVPLGAVATLIGLGFGFTIAGVTRTPEAANSVNLVVGLFLFVFAGTTIPLQALPEPLPDVALYAVPFAAAIAAMRDVMLRGAGAGEIGGELLVAVAWMVIAIALSVRSYPMTAD